MISKRGISTRGFLFSYEPDFPQVLRLSDHSSFWSHRHRRERQHIHSVLATLGYSPPSKHMQVPQIAQEEVDWVYATEDLLDYLCGSWACS
jgi:hypothetical protein